jgi:hypothetical protein
MRYPIAVRVDFRSGLLPFGLFGSYRVPSTMSHSGVVTPKFLSG